MDPMIVQAVVAPIVLLIGVSHLTQPQLWVRFFDALRRTGLASLIIPMYTLPIALVLVVGHNVWEWGWPLFLTIAGWGMLGKCSLYLFVPGLADRLLEKRVANSALSFRVVGAVMALFGGVLTWQAWV